MVGGPHANRPHHHPPDPRRRPGEHAADLPGAGPPGARCHAPDRAAAGTRRQPAGGRAGHAVSHRPCAGDAPGHPAVARPGGLRRPARSTCAISTRTSSTRIPPRRASWAGWRRGGRACGASSTRSTACRSTSTSRTPCGGCTVRPSGARPGGRTGLSPSAATWPTARAAAGLARARTSPSSIAAWTSMRCGRASRCATRSGGGGMSGPGQFVFLKIARLFHDEGARVGPAGVCRGRSGAIRPRSWCWPARGSCDPAWRPRSGGWASPRRYGSWACVPPDRIPGLLWAADAVVHAGLREGLARVLPQAGICSRPVVTYNIGGAREMVRDGENGYLLSAPRGPGNPAAHRCWPRRWAASPPTPTPHAAWAASGRTMCSASLIIAKARGGFEKVYEGVLVK